MDNNSTQQDQLNLLLAEVAKLKAENEALKSGLGNAATSTMQPPPIQSKKTKATESPYTTPTSTPVLVMQGLRNHARSKFTKRSPGTQAAAASAAAAAAAAPNSNAATTLNQYSQKQETMSVTELLDEMHALKLKVNTLGLDDEEVQNHLFVQNGSHKSKE